MAEVARVPLWQRALLTGRKAGLHDWIVLTWNNPVQFQGSLAADPRLKDLTCQVIDMRFAPIVHLHDALPQDDVIVISGSAVFDHRVLIALQTGASPTLGILPAASDGQVLTGLLRCSGPLLESAMQRAWKVMPTEPDPLQPVATVLLTETTITTLDVSPYTWFPITEPLTASVAEAESQLLRRMGRDGDSPVVRLVARRVSRALTRWLLPTRVKPNHITLASGLIGICGALLLAQPATSSQVLGSLLFLLSTIIDGCDGELARLTLQESAFGAKLDVTMDNVVHGVLFPAIALGQYRQHQESLYLILGALALGGVAVSMLVFLPHVLRPQTTHRTNTRLHESLASRDFAYLLPILAAWQKLPWFLWATAIGTYVFAAAWVVLLWRQRRLNLK
ncbi:MAG: CDP-alcohol phosphatidyltransferase family protein, partial [Candidatus Tectomicrobia bacterium]|nr:CDP-alcohol phosphatidyltransferase family protein [Candidatus Tectomicrobia bacterium]